MAETTQTVPLQSDDAWRRLASRVLESAAMPFACLIAFAVPGLSWLAQLEYLATHDGDVHRWRIWEYWQLWQAGDLTARWAPDLSYGFGSPLFTFYNPLPYLLGSIAMSHGLDSAAAARAVFALALALGFVGMFVLAGEWYAGSTSRRWASLLAATANLYAPYVLGDVSRRGAMAESLALGLAPWLLWSTLRVLRHGRPIDGVALALSTAAVLLSHNLTAVMTAAMAAVMAGAYIVRARVTWRGRAELLGRLAWAVALGVVAAGYYLLPVALESGYVQLNRDTGPGDTPIYVCQFVSLDRLVALEPLHGFREDYAVGAGGVNYGPRLGLAQLLSISIAVALAARAGAWRHPRLVGLLIGLVAAVFMALPSSALAWKAVPGLAFFQFPWRFFGAAALLGALLTGSIAAIGRRPALSAILVGLVLVGAASRPGAEPTPWRQDWETAPNLQEYERQADMLGLSSFDEFLPSWVTRTKESLLSESSASPGVKPVTLSLVEAGVDRWRFASESSGAGAVTLDTFYYPHWSVEVDGLRVPARPQGELGLLAFEVPAGRHEISVGRVVPTYQLAADRVSTEIVVLLVCLAGAGIVRQAYRSGRAHRALVVAAVGALAWVLMPAVAKALTPASPPPFVLPSQTAASTGPARLLGVRADRAMAARSGRLDVTLLFESPVERPADEPIVRARLLDAQGSLIAEDVHMLNRGLRPVRIWQPNMLLTDRFSLAVPAGQALDRCYLSVGFDGFPGGYMADLGLSGEATAPAVTLPPPSGIWQPARWSNGLELTNVALSSDLQPRSSHPLDLRLDGARRVDAVLSWARAVSTEPTVYRATVRVVDSQGVERASGTSSLAFGKGQSEQYVEIHARVASLLPPGRYSFLLSVVSADGSLLGLPAGDSRVRGDDELSLHELRFGPEGDGLPAAASAVDVEFGDGIRLLGYQRTVAEDSVDVITYWQATDAPKGDYTVFIHLLGEDGRLVDQYDGIPYGGEAPTNRWRAGEVVPFSARLRLPPDGGAFRLRVGLYESETAERLPTRNGRDSASLGLVSAVSIAQDAPILFENGVSLIGYELQRLGGDGLVTLSWQRRGATIPDAYSVFVHVLDEDGRLVAQGDGPPELGERPTTDWSTGELILDPHRVKLPPGERFRVRVGLYRLGDNQRLAVLSDPAVDFVDLGELR